MDHDKTPAGDPPAWIEMLQQTFGSPSQAAFGTAVFAETTADTNASSNDNELETRAQAWYQYFCGPNWEKFGPRNWMGTWLRVDSDAELDVPILQVLAQLQDWQTRQSGEQMLEGHADAATAKRVLSQAFDDPTMDVRQIYRIGDGNAMCGILIAGRRPKGESAFLAFLLD